MSVFSRRSLQLRLSLRYRMLAATALVLAVLGAALLSNALRQEFENYREHLGEEGGVALEGLVLALRPAVEANDRAGVERTLALFAKRRGIDQISWINNAGQAVAVRGPLLGAEAPDWFRRWLQTPPLVLNRELLVHGRMLGHATLSYSPRLFENRIWQALLLQSAFLAAGCLVLFALIATVLRRGLTPLNRLMEAARAIEQGDYGVRIRVAPDDAPELKDSLHAFNKMAAGVESLMWSLSEHHRAMDNAANVTETDLQGNITYANGRFCRVSGFPAEQLIGRKHAVVNSGHHPREFFREMWDTISAGRVWRGEVKNKSADGRLFWSDTTITPILGDNGRPIKYVAFRFDITSRKENEARLRELNRVIASRGAGFEDQTKAIFDLGCRSFGLDVAVLARIEQGRYEVQQVLGPPKSLMRGQVLDLAETYCAQTVRTNGPLVIEHAARSGWRDHPCYRRFGLEAYMGMPVQVWGRLHGTLSFCSLKPSNRRFTEADRDLVRLIAEWAGAEMERRQAEEMLHREKEHAQVTLQSIGDGVITTDASGAVVYLNPVAESLTGWTLLEARGLPLEQVFRLVSGDDSLQPENLAARVMQEGGSVLRSGHAQLAARDERMFTVEDSAAPIRNRDGRIVGVVVVFHDISEAHAMARQIDYQASHDALTGLPNRHAFENRLGEFLENAQLHDVEHALLYLDMDQFKVINDVCGHVAGDALLRQVAELLQGRLRRSDLLARLGGDEFGVLLENCALHNRAIQIAEDLLAQITDYRFVWNDKTFNLSASIGITAINAASRDAASVLSAADTACFAAKDGGRKRIRVYRDQDTEVARRHGEMHWVSHINKSFEDGRFRLYHQQISPLRPHGSEGDHFEVLLRMVDEQGRLVAPGEFLPAAERYNLMPAMDRWVVRHALALSEARYGGASERVLDTCAINISGASLNDERFLEFVLDQFAIHDVPPQAICFEITETVAISNLSRASTFIRELRKIGCRFALDDFGAGMSSFAYLKNLDVDYLKIDGTFVRDMADDAVGYAMVEAINRVGQVMELRTIAEFVENDDIREKLAMMGVDYVQGYGIHKPEPLLH